MRSEEFQPRKNVIPELFCSHDAYGVSRFLEKPETSARTTFRYTMKYDWNFSFSTFEGVVFNVPLEKFKKTEKTNFLNIYQNKK